MSPLVLRPRARNSARNSNSDPTDQHWSMLLFESASAGILAVFLGFSLLLTLVGLFVVIVWPLTFWDLANTGIEKLEPWGETALWSLFAGGAAGGYWCFSGLAFKEKRPGQTVRPPSRTGRSVRI